MNMPYYRILSIDPGVNFTGTTIMDIYRDGKTHVRFVETIKTEKMLSSFKDIEHTYGTRYAKIHIIGKQVMHLVSLYRPNVVVAEQPFYNPRRPGAYGPLLELLSALRTMACSYDSSLRFDTIDASGVKRSMGVSGNSGDKSLMHKALLKCDLLYESYLDPLTFDEHSVDSVCIGLIYNKHIEMNI